MAIKIVFFDVDWTLYDHKRVCFDQSGIAAIKNLKKTHDCKIILCTARPFHSMRNLGVFKLGIKWDGYICSNGAVAKVGKTYLRKSLMDNFDVKRISEKAISLGLTMERVGIKSRSLIAPKNSYVDKLYSVYKEVTPPVKSYRGQRLTGLLLFAPDEFDAEMKSVCSDVIYSRFDDFGVDIMGVPHLKGDAIPLVIKHYGFSSDEALAIGDDLQDISMAKAVGNFVCMGQGKEEVKAVAQYVTTSIDQAGVRNALLHFNLLS